jgi:hypothetical protein
MLCAGEDHMLRRRILLGVMLSLLVSGVCSAPVGAQQVRGSDKSMTLPAPLLDAAKHPGSDVRRQRSTSSLALSWMDPVGDAGGPAGAIDVTTVAAGYDFNGTIFFEIDSPQAEIADGDILYLAVDADENPLTGNSGWSGAEYLVEIDGDGLPTTWSQLLYRWTGTTWDPNTPQDTLRVAYDFGASIAIHSSELGNTTGFNFFIWAYYPDVAGTCGVEFSCDFAPDSGTWNFDDGLAPTAAAVRSSPVGGTANMLEWSVSDNSGGASTVIRIKRAGSATASSTLSFAPDANGAYSWNWPVPATIRGYQRFCVQGIDAFLNASPENCRKINFRRMKTRVVRTNIRRADSGTSQFWSRVWLENLPRGTFVTIDCVRRCTLHQRATDSGTFVSRKFSDRRLRDGAVIIVRATKPRWVGFYERITIGSGTRVARIVRCMAPGIRRPSPRGVCS